MRAYENKNEFTEKFKKSTQKQREQMKFLKNSSKTDGAILNDKKNIQKMKL